MWAYRCVPFPAPHIFGGHATPLHFLKMPLQYALQALEVRHRFGSRFSQNTYGLSSKSKEISSTYESSAGAIIADTDVTDGPYVGRGVNVCGTASGAVCGFERVQILSANAHRSANF